MAAPAELSGQVFGRWTVTGRAGKAPGGGILWDVRCECGNTGQATTSALRGRNTQSCGCLQRDTRRRVSAEMHGAFARNRQDLERAGYEVARRPDGQ